MSKSKKLIISGGAGLVGFNLSALLEKEGFSEIVVLDKHTQNLKIFRSLFPKIKTLEVDLSKRGEWEKEFQKDAVLIMLQAQIGGNEKEAFEKNNIQATQNLLMVAKESKIQYLVHVSSSVVNSMADDLYTQSKKRQEALVQKSNIPSVILRPTLMFGWFDRKHLGWLSRFMKKMPIFPVPGNGKYMRQPLYVMDFCRIISHCVLHQNQGAYNISGTEKINYIDLILMLKRATKSKTPVIKIPCFIFSFLLWLWALFDKNPPFTNNQLKALVTPDCFELIDWEGIFKVHATKTEHALFETFQDATYSHIAPKF